MRRCDYPLRVAVALGLAGMVPACGGGRSSVPPTCSFGSSGDGGCAYGLVAYQCSSSSRPDEDPDFVDGVPSGLICTDEGPGAASGAEAFCCSSAPTPCAQDPVAGCASPTVGYQCLGSYRPETFDPSLYCGEGLVEGDLIVYCCGTTPPPAGCSQVTEYPCAATLTGWTCHDTTLPSEAELGDNQSRADFNLLVCSIPNVVPSTTGTIWEYCCFTPTFLPAGGSCLEDTTVAGCAVASFGFACTGVDTPDQDYPGITCAHAGVSGTNPQGYAATLYCCDYQTVDGG